MTMLTGIRMSKAIRNPIGARKTGVTIPIGPPNIIIAKKPNITEIKATMILVEVRFGFTKP